MRYPDFGEFPVGSQIEFGWPWTKVSLQLPEDLLNKIDWPTISIVTPSYNQAAFLEETIRSVLLQGYPNLEYIIIDGGSTDGSLEIIKRYGPWLKYWVSEPDKGQTYAISKGLGIATGQILNWLNSDDYLMPGALYAIADASNFAGEDIFALCGDALIVNEQGLPIKTNRVKALEPNELLLPSSPPCSGGVQASWYFSTAAWKAVRGLNLELDFTMDTDLFYRINKMGGRFIPVNYTIAAYRSHTGTKTRYSWKKSINYKRRFYYRELLQLERSEQNYYKKRIQRLLFSFYLRDISSLDSFSIRLQKVSSAFREFPCALLSRYLVKRCLKLLFLPPDEI